MQGPIEDLPRDRFEVVILAVKGMFTAMSTST